MSRQYYEKIINFCFISEQAKMAFTWLLGTNPSLINSLLVAIETNNFYSAMKLMETMSTLCHEEAIPDWIRTVFGQTVRTFVPKPIPQIDNLQEFWSYYQLFVNNYELEMMRLLVYRLRTVYSDVVNPLTSLASFKFMFVAEYFAFPQGRKLNQEICVQLLHLENALTRMVKAARHHGEEIKSYLLTPTIQNYAIHFVSCPHFLKFCFSCQLNLPPSISMNDRTSFVNFTPEKCLACTVPVIKGLRHIILSNT